jgi:hypothetical protein
MKEDLFKKINLEVVSVEPYEKDNEEFNQSLAFFMDDDYKLDPDLMYARFIMCHEGTNRNGDTFTKEVLKEAQFTPRWKPIDWEHGQPMIGTILDSRYMEDSQGKGYIEAIGVIWKFIYPELSASIKEKSKTGELRLSMECYWADANYIVGETLYSQEQADELGISNYVGREYLGKKVIRVFQKAIFGGVGVVANPADREAVFLSVAKDLSQGTVEKDVSLAIADIINRSINDFKDKSENKEIADAVFISNYVRSFDKAKSSVVALFNGRESITKEQMLSEINNILGSFTNELSELNNSFYKGLASEDSLDDINLKEEQEEMTTIVNTETVELAKANEMVETAKAEAQVKLDGIVLELENAKASILAKDATIADLELAKATFETEKATFETEKATFEAEKSELETSVADLQAKLDDIDATNLAEARLAELKESGVEFSEVRLAKEVAKLKAMASEDYADYKELLVEVASKTVSASTEVLEEVSVEDEANVEVTIDNTDQASASINVETAPAVVVKPFGHLAD